ncbi:MAG: aminotransferase class V-fold PLP-dependent enzyme, partial [Rhizobiaceae bacterium]|nr:aminotransferase class V-fold PLP-dependent enzyme [Rhizobiaceae bacterium]
QATTAFLGTGHELVTVNDDDALMEAIDEETAVVLLTQVDYKTGRMLDMAKITAHAHEKGALIIWDLCHSAGAFPVELDACDADFAIGCGYKYLNGGPGAPAFIYVKKELQNEAIQPLSGWFAHESPFDFDPEFKPATSIKRYLTGTPPVLSLTALNEALKIWKDVDMRLIRQKSVGLSQLFIKSVEETCEGLTLASPRDPQQRGSQVSFTFDGDGYALMQALIAEGVVGDFRQPDILRFGFAPLYIRYGDVVRAAEILADILKTERWKDEKFSVRSEVT